MSGPATRRRPAPVARGPRLALWASPAPLERRFYAFAIDKALGWGLALLTGWLAWTVLGESSRVVDEPASGAGLGVTLAAGVGVALGAGLGVAAWQGAAGLTPGKALVGLCAVEARTGLPIGVRRAVLRGVGLGLAGLPTLGLGLALTAWTALTDPGRTRRGWHDRLAGSVVLDVRSHRAAHRAAHPAAAAAEALPAAQPMTGIVNLTALRLAAAPAPAPARPPASATRSGSSAGARWRVSFDTGGSIAVAGVGLVGRSPVARPGEPVRHVVRLPSDDLSLSSTHAQFHLADDGALVVMDRGSGHGSALLRGGAVRDLPAGRPTTLLDGDRVRLGDREMRVTREA